MVYASSFHSTHACTPNVHVMITCTRLKHAILLVDCTDKRKGWWRSGRTSKDKLPQLRGSLANDVATFPSYRASQSRSSTRRLPFTTCIKPSIESIVISVYLNYTCYLLSYTSLFTKLHLHKILLYVTFLMKFFRSMVLSRCLIFNYVCC